jgi:hypothetical protein
MTNQGIGAVGYTESINQPTKIRLADGNEVAITDWEWMMLYSVTDVLSGSTDTELYAFNYVESNPVSHSGNIPIAAQRNATLKDCNNTGKGEMPAEEEYITYGLAVEVWQFLADDEGDGESFYSVAAPGLPIPRAANVAIATTRLVLSLEVTQKDFYQGDISWFAHGGGPFMSASGGAAGLLRTYASNGLQSKDSIDRSPVPVHIGGTEKYKAIFSNSDGTPLNWVDEAGNTDDTAIIRFKTQMFGLRKRSAA